METIDQQVLTGERALFKGRDLTIVYSTFADGESPLKESANIELAHTSFKWKYPLWYSRDVTAVDCTLFEMARAGIWYTRNISMTNCTIEAPKNFRRSSGIALENVDLPNAEETLWNCEDVSLENVTAKGNYFAMNSTNVRIDGFTLVGNYSFDGCRDVEIKNARMLSKDAFWNCENVTVYDSYISGEYLGWNAKNVRLVNCTVESEQGMCYMDGIVMENCRLINTDLAFEYCSGIDATVDSVIDSVKNPYDGRIVARGIGEVIFDDDVVDSAKTEIALTAPAGAHEAASAPLAAAC